MQILQEISKSVGPYILGVLLCLGINLILGLEREYDKNKEAKGFAGIRTFPIVAILEFSIAQLTVVFTPWILYSEASQFHLHSNSQLI